MEDFYPEAYRDFMFMAETQDVSVPTGVCSSLVESKYEELFRATTAHYKPLQNALGPKFKDIHTEKRVRQLFESM